MLDGVEGLKACLMQIHLENGGYKIRCGKEMRKLIAEKERKEQPIEKTIQIISLIIS